MSQARIGAQMTIRRKRVVAVLQYFLYRGLAIPGFYIHSQLWRFWRHVAI